MAVLGGLASGMVCLNIYYRPINVMSDKEKQASLEKLDGYDIFLKDIKNIKEQERKKLLFDLKSREQHLKELKNPSKKFDVLVIGGGCNGAGVVFDASTRGLSCALIDSGDFASGTSSRSTKLIHGGIRYLEQAFKLERGFVDKLKLVVEGLDERNFMLNTASYMNKNLEMAIPCKNIFILGYYYAGVCLYHFLSYFKWCFSDYQYRLPRPKLISKSKMKELIPSLKGNCYGIKFSEGQMNDARLDIQTLLTSSVDSYVPGMKGTVLANYVECIGLLKDSSGKIIGAKLKDKIENKEFTVKANAVVNCAGIFSDAIRIMDNPSAQKRIVGSRGVHIMLPHEYTKSNVGVLIPKTADGRIMFILPYQGMTIAGTTDHACDLEHFPSAPEGDIKEIADVLKDYFNGDIQKECIAAWCGIRPLVAAKPVPKSGIGKVIEVIKGKYYKILGKKPKESSTKALTRSHELEVSNSGLISLMGGKWTAYRKMGQDTVDLILKEHPELNPTTKESISHNVRMIGAYTNKSIEGSEKNISEFIPSYKRFLNEYYNIDLNSCNHLIECYGTNAIQVAQLGKDLKLNEKLHESLPVLKIQVIFAIRKELAVSVKDVVFRRLGIGFTNSKIAEELIPIVASIMAKELRWNSEKQADEMHSAKLFLKRLG